MLNWLRRIAAKSSEIDPGPPSATTPEPELGMATTTTGVEELLKRGNRLLDQGKLMEAERCYRDLLQRDAGHLPARVNLGFVLREAGRLDEASKVLEQVLELDPNQVDALFLLGIKAQGEGNVALASEYLQRCHRVQPGFLPVIAPLCNLLFESRQIAEAKAIVQSALRRNDASPDLHCVLAKLHASQGNYDEALAGCDRALRLSPDHAGALSDRGLVLHALRRYPQALASLERALQHDPGSADIHNNMAVVLKSQNAHEAALQHVAQALVLRPGFPQALHNRGQLQSLRKDYKAAAATYSALLSVAPDHEQAVGNLLWNRLYICDWQDYETLVDRVHAGVRQGRTVIEPWAFLAVSDSASDQRRCAEDYAMSKFPPSQVPLWTGQRYQHDRIRIAYLSADFHEHATSYLMAELFERHDRSRFRTVAISFGPASDGPMRRRLLAAFDEFLDVRTKSDLEVARLMRDMEIDIAVDLKGYTTDARPGILAHRPAPIQVNYLGYPGSMGAEYIDYILADRWVIPLADFSNYSEAVVHLPGSYQVNDSKRRIAASAPTRAAVGLPDTGFVFCCFNNNFKITPRVFQVWMNILRAVEGSVLWLLEDNPDATVNLRREADRRGVSSKRLVFAPRIPMEDHLARYSLADLFLDTSPCNAHTTASDALWAGLPILTSPGTSFAGRVAASLLNTIDLPELIASDLDGFEAKALELATQPGRLAAARNHPPPTRQSSPLFNGGRFAWNLELAYSRMWQQALDGRPPASFSVQNI